MQQAWRRIGFLVRGGFRHCPVDETVPPAIALQGGRRSLGFLSLRYARALLAEDNPVNQKVAALMLEGMGCEVDIAANGLQRRGCGLEERTPLIWC